MNLVLGLLVVAVVTAATVTTMLLVRRRATAGSRFTLRLIDAQFTIAGGEVTPRCDEHGFAR